MGHNFLNVFLDYWKSLSSYNLTILLSWKEKQLNIVKQQILSVIIIRSNKEGNSEVIAFHSNKIRAIALHNWQ